MSDHRYNQSPVPELSLSFLRKHFLGRQNPSPLPQYQDDSLLFKSMCEKTNKAAAVLIPILEKPTGLSCCLLVAQIIYAVMLAKLAFPAVAWKGQTRHASRRLLEKLRKKLIYRLNR